MEKIQVKYQDLLIHEYEVRTSRNPSYSLRAYSRDLGISVSSLSRILSGQQDLSLKKAQVVASVLGLSPSEKDYFFVLIKSRHARSEKTQSALLSKLASQEMSGAELSLEYFKTISDWQYFAIIELTAVTDFQSDAVWIAKRLGITKAMAEDSITRLLKLELIEEDEKGNLSKTYDFRATPSGIPSRALKQHHQQIMKKAETALFECDIAETDFASIAFSMNSNDISWAREELKKFRRELTKRLSNNKSKDRIYELSMQLFPMDQKNNTNSIKSKKRRNEKEKYENK
jgi:uncharacterized protein (TIGR02147 family)